MNAVQFVRAWETHAQSPQALRRRYGSQRVILSSSFVPPSVRFSLGNVLSADLCRRLHLKSFKLSKPINAVISLVPKEIAVKSLSYTRTTLTRTLTIIGTYPRPIQCIVAVCVITFAFLGLAPSIQFIRRRLFQRRDWDKSRTKHIVTSYIRPLILWAAVLVICRGLDPIVLSSETSQAVKDRFVNFLRSLSTVLTFAYCTARITRHIQKVMMERQNTGDSRNLGTRFISTAVSTSVWVAAVCLFMELLGFSTQKWLTAGGFGTVLLTLAGREIFTNFLSSVMIHATRPFVEFEWVQTKIDGQEVSGTVEHVGWWSPTIIRGEDREAVHIPNHKFTMSVVRNLSQKTHWRIKTYIGLSHLDANKIHLIVADMRKVLSKQPQVEHRRLHRRVFFDNIDSVNQSLMIMVSCFVKTSHYEEYLSVKEIVLLKLLKVISHHNARLATPIRTIQRIYDEVETRQSPYRNVSTDGKPLLLLEASAVTTDVKQEVNTELNQIQKPALEGLDSMGLNVKDMSLLGAAFEKPSVKIDGETVEPDSSKQKDANKEAKNAKGVNSKDLREPGKVKTKEPQHGNREVKVKEPSQQDNVKVKAQKDNAKPQEQTNAKEYPKESSKVKAKESQQPKMKEEEDPWREPTQSEEEKLKNLEENIVLGVALAGCKRTLPLDGQEFAASNNMENSTSHKIGDKST